MKKFLLLLLIPLCLLCGCTPAAENPLAAAEGDVRILFINVGKADAALLMTGEKNYLIDTGTEDSAEKLLAVLSLLQVDSLDGVFLSHTHKDHTGGLETLSAELPISMLYHTDITTLTKKGVNKFERFSQELSIAHTALSAGDVLTLDKDVSAEVLAPLVANEDDDNDQSLVLMITANGKKILFTGDMQFAEEQTLLNADIDLAADVLKVGNHGNPDATLDRFAQAVTAGHNAADPAIAVISTDTSVDADSANRRVLEALGDAAIFITEDSGTGILVTISANGAITAETIN